jgi:hypothetical protein
MGTVLFTLFYLTETQNLLFSQQFAYLANNNETEVSFNFVKLILNILSSFAKLRKTPTSFVKSARPPHATNRLPMDGFS